MNHFHSKLEFWVKLCCGCEVLEMRDKESQMPKKDCLAVYISIKLVVMTHLNANKTT